MPTALFSGREPRSRHPVLGIVVSFLLLLTGVGPGWTGAAPSAPAPGHEEASRVPRAEALLKAGEAEKVRALLEPACRDGACPSQELFLLSLACAKLQRYDEAEAGLRRILEREPGAGRTRLELARVLAAKGELDAARTELVAVRQSAPPKGVTRNIDSFLAAMDEAEAAAAEGRSWSVRPSLGFLYDTNATQGADTDSVTIYDQPFYLSEAARQQADGALVYGLDASWRQALSPKVALMAQFSGSFTDYFRINWFDTLEGALALGPAFSLGSWQLSLPLYGHYIKYGFDSPSLIQDYYCVSYGLLPQARYRVSDRLQIGTGLGYLHKEYGMGLDRRGDLFTISPFLRFAPDKDSVVNFTVFLNPENQNQDIYSNLSYGALASYSRTFFEDLTVTAAPMIRLTDYQAERLAFGTTQHDVLLQAKVSLAYRIKAAWGLTPEVSYAYTRNNSNIEAFAYSRSQLYFGLSKAF